MEYRPQKWLVDFFLISAEVALEVYQQFLPVTRYESSGRTPIDARQVINWLKLAVMVLKILNEVI